MITNEDDSILKKQLKKYLSLTKPLVNMYEQIALTNLTKKNKVRKPLILLTFKLSL